MKNFAIFFMAVFILAAFYFFITEDGESGWICAIGAGLCSFLMNEITEREARQWAIRNWKFWSNRDY